MPAAVIPIGERTRTLRSGTWSLLEVCAPGAAPVPLGILLVDGETGEFSQRLRPSAEFTDLEEQEIDILDFLSADLEQKAREMGGYGLIGSLEDSLSDFLRINDRTAITWSGDPRRTVNRLFDEHVDSEVRQYVTHLPLFGLRAAATKFGEGMDSEQEGWVRVPGHLRLTEQMFVARVVGRSMEPLIPDGSLCVFRTGVTGSRQGKRLLIEKFGETDFASRYTVKRYTSRKIQNEPDADWEHESIRLEPLNREFEAFELGPDEFRVVAEFVEVLGD
jgi:phage repressor protein C with HTH and peptisase S24 domain